jgi:DNA-directed RNA polymerase subunit H (RpoH/RPB5)
MDFYNDKYDFKDMLVYHNSCHILSEKDKYFVLEYYTKTKHIMKTVSINDFVKNDNSVKEGDIVCFVDKNSRRYRKVIL